MRHLDLFSGIGGFALAASWVWPEHEIVAFCDNNLFCQKILRKHCRKQTTITIQ
jgi:DNA (cytosine-5)-methyltransferase 1